jgi:hypothetical protein
MTVISEQKEPIPYLLSLIIASGTTTVNFKPQTANFKFTPFLDKLHIQIYISLNYNI